jgi:hypothetical protein
MTQSCIPNYTPLNPNEFRVVLHSAPYLSFEIQTVSLPSISMQDASPTETPFTTVRIPGDHIEWDSLSVTFLVDQDLQGWIEMYNWIRGLGFPSTFDEYKALQINNQLPFKNVWNKTTSDISIFTSTAHRNSNLEFKFYDAYPTMISAPTLSTTNEGQPVQTSKCMFSYTLYDVTPIRIETGV